jgi:hypothetical protein
MGKLKIFFCSLLIILFLWLCIDVTVIVTKLKYNNYSVEENEWIDVCEIDYYDGIEIQKLYSTFKVIYEGLDEITAEEYSNLPKDYAYFYESFPQGYEQQLNMDKSTSVPDGIIGQIVPLDISGKYYKTKVKEIEISYLSVKNIDSRTIQIEKYGFEQRITVDYFNIVYFIA